MVDQVGYIVVLRGEIGVAVTMIEGEVTGAGGVVVACMRSNWCVPAVIETARKAVGAATACLYTSTTPTLAKLIAMTAGTREFLRYFFQSERTQPQSH